MGSLRFVGSLKSQVSFAKEPYKRDYVLQKRPIVLRSLLTVATPYLCTKQQVLPYCRAPFQCSRPWAVWLSTLPPICPAVAVYCSVLQCDAVWCSVMQCVAVCCSVLQCVAVCCAISVHSSLRRLFIETFSDLSGCCSVLWCVAVCCGIWQCVAVCGAISVQSSLSRLVIDTSSDLSGCCSVL